MQLCVRLQEPDGDAALPRLTLSGLTQVPNRPDFTRIRLPGLFTPFFCMSIVTVPKTGRNRGRLAVVQLQPCSML